MALSNITTEFYCLFRTISNRKHKKEGLHLSSQVSACSGSVLEVVFDAVAPSLCASVAHNDVCVGLSAYFSW